jgi:hypothetical protein
VFDSLRLEAAKHGYAANYLKIARRQFCHGDLLDQIAVRTMDVAIPADTCQCRYWRAAPA